MDALAAAECDVCGYPRTGLPAVARCPECGEPPPRLAKDGVAAGVEAAAPPVTAARLAHVRLVAAGLLLLVTSSVTALGVTLVMPIGPISLPAVNVPAPKLHAAALVQRTIGGQPGPWGVAGTTAALTGVIGLWLLTTPRSLRADEESAFSARRLARWSGVLSAGAVLGVLLSGVDPYIPPRGDIAAKLVGLALVLCELPANAFLYHYLYRLSLELGDRRAAGALDRCRWLVPVLTAGAAAIVVYSLLHNVGWRSARWPVSARVAMGLYGAAVVAVGAAATAAVLGLLGTCAARACAGWLARAGDAAGRLPALVRAARAVVARDPRRWAVAAGIALWLLAFAHVSWFSAAHGTRYWVYRGQLPLLDFVGPKVLITPLAGSLSLRYEYYSTRQVILRLALASLAVVWLMTWRAPAGAADARGARITAWAARWSAVLVGGMLMGAGLWADGAGGRPFRHPRVVAGVVVGAEALTTVLIYLHLANVAAAAGHAALARRVRVLGVTAAVLGMAPLGWMLQFPIPYRTGPRSLVTLAVCATQVAAMLAVTFLCAAALARLAWALVARTSGGGAESGAPPLVVGAPAVPRRVFTPG